jgi:YD repeat-containing protein
LYNTNGNLTAMKDGNGNQTTITHDGSSFNRVSKVTKFPICQPLRRILDERKQPSGFILLGPKGKPMNLNNLAKRVIRPALAKKNIPWAGWYTLRRGIGTLATALDSDLAAKGWLRRANVATTHQFYIKDVPPETQRAAKKVGDLFSADGLVQMRIEQPSF